jgi:protein phosphatase 2C family protein 2/3
MEDAHATVLNLDEKTGDEKASFFAVYDGHGGESDRLKRPWGACHPDILPFVGTPSGSEAAKYAATAVHEVLAKNKAYKEGNYAQALKEAFLNADEGFYNGM